MDDEQELKKRLVALHHSMRGEVKERYGRINPFTENLFDWVEKGKFCGSENTRIYDSATLIGDVKLGSNVWVGPFCMLDGSGGLTVGRNCDISTGVKIYTHDTVKRALTAGRHPIEKAAVSIGDCCFIGSDAVILKGVTIGSHCVVAANSLVNADVPSNTIVAGMPARRIGTVEMKDGDVVLHYDS